MKFRAYPNATLTHEVVGVGQTWTWYILFYLLTAPLVHTGIIVYEYT